MLLPNGEPGANQAGAEVSPPVDPAVGIDFPTQPNGALELVVGEPVDPASQLELKRRVGQHATPFLTDQAIAATATTSTSPTTSAATAEQTIVTAAPGNPNNSSAADGSKEGQRPEDESGLQHLERIRRQRILNMYRSLRSQNEDAPIPESVIDQMLRRFPEWDYYRDPDTPQVHYLTRKVIDSSVPLRLRAPETAERSLHRDTGSLTVRVNDSSVRVKDMQTVFQIEAQYPSHFVRSEIEARQTGKQYPSKLLAEFRNTTGEYINEGDLFTDREAFILRCTASFGSPYKLAVALSISPIELNKLVRPIRELAGIKFVAGKPDSYIELTLLALALGYANTNHLPKPLKHEQDSLTPSEEEVMIYDFSFDPKQRQAFRQRRSANSITSAWSKIYRKLNIRGKEAKHEAVLHAVKAGFLQLPDAKELQARLAARAKPRASASQ